MSDHRGRTRLERVSHRLVRDLGALMFASVCCLAGLVQHAAHAQQIWFGPQSDLTSARGIETAPDYPELFATPSAWPEGMARTKVLIVNHRSILMATPDELRAQLAFLQQHNIQLAVTMGVVYAVGCGSGVEGMVYSLHSNEAVANLVKRAGGTIDYLVADEPFTFGHESASGNSCRYPIQQVAQSFAYQVASVRAVFPGLQVVDDEASSRLTDLAADAAWVDALTAAFGPAQPFVISLDVQWQKPVWLTWARPFVSMLKSRGIGYGIIYHSINKYKTDLAWLQRAAAFAATWERTVSLRPTYVVLQSWSPAPSHLLPETDPTALTSFILTYCNQITRFRSSCNGLH